VNNPARIIVNSRPDPVYLHGDKSMPIPQFENDARSPLIVNLRAGPQSLQGENIIVLDRNPIWVTPHRPRNYGSTLSAKL